MVERLQIHQRERERARKNKNKTKQRKPKRETNKAQREKESLVEKLASQRDKKGYIAHNTTTQHKVIKEILEREIESPFFLALVFFC